MYKLIIEDDEGKTTVVPLIRDEISIGRKEGNTIRLTERNVSRKHARLIRQNGAVYIEDLTSHNGIKVNGDRIAGRAAVGEGDRIQIGDYQLSVKIDKSDQKSNPGGRSAQVEEPLTTPFMKQSASEATAQIPTPSSSSSVPTVPVPVVTMPVGAATTGEKPARLIVSSKQFYRQEFPLDKAAVVIGRTDENDVVVNHRSISRHHAKIVREGGHYHVIDLQSANGVRVNGEEYGKVELRKGDLIDLGHVRFVFVPPGQDHDIGKPFDPNGAGRRSGIILFLLVLLIIGGATVLIQHYRASLTNILSKGPDADGEAAKILLDVDSDLLGKRWDDAVAKSDKVLHMDGISQKPRETAQAKKEKGEQEKKAQGFYDRFAGAAGERKYDEALQVYRELGVDSVYKQMAKETYDKIFPLFVADHLERAEKARGARNCNEFHEEVQKVLVIEANHLKALEVKGRPCEEKAAQQTEPQPRDRDRDRDRGPGRKIRPGPSQASPGETGDPTPSGEGGDPDTVLREAQNAYLNGDFGKAIELARPVKSSSASAATRAWRIIGAAACNLKDLKLVGDAYRHLDPNARQFIIYVCQRGGVVFTGGQFKLAE